MVMSALNVNASVVCPRAPLLLGRRTTTAPPRRPLAPLAQAAKQNQRSRIVAENPPGLAGKTAGPSEPEKRLANLVSKMASVSAVVKQLTSEVKSLKSQLLKLKQELQAEQKRKAEEQQKLQAEQRNRSRQLNPACKDFWKSRGYSHAPWTWQAFEATGLRVAHAWPSAVETLGGYDDFRAIPAPVLYGLMGIHNCMPGEAYAALEEIFDNDDVFG